MVTRFLALFFLLAAVAGCAPAELRWQHDARMVYDRVRLAGAGQLLPAEFGSLEETLGRGDALLREDDDEAAERFYNLALAKGKLLEEHLAAEKHRRAEEARLRAEAEQRELARQRAIQDEQRRLAEEKARAEAEAAAEAERRRRAEKSRLEKERTLPAYHTVKRGETLPQIASQADVYNDYALWPLIYRANRDQISDPRHIWPGQVLRIPRNISREDIAEARRYAQERPLR